MKKLITAAVAGLLLVGAAAPASAYTGFVGKGEVQTALGLNNPQLQAQADDLQFAVVTEEVTEVSWTCTNTNNQNVQERERTTTTTTEGVVASTARVRNQVTGFNLTGFSGTPTTESVIEGNQLNSCPTNWVLTPAGDPEVVSSSTSLTVNGVTIG